MKKISVLGSTGSIGTQVLDVLRNLRQYEIFCITANSNVEILEAQIREFQPQVAVMYDEKSAYKLRKRVKDTHTRIYSGEYGLKKAVSDKYLDMVVICLVGMGALVPCLEAIKNRVDIAIATKEILVSAGHIIKSYAKKYNVSIIPIDSEHSAIMQCIDTYGKDNINKIILTASGGPFRGFNKRQLKNVTVEDALTHPTWNMGKKITIDSATMMNKALEIIEASVLFDLTPDKIDIVVHPQSIVHSMVQYTDGSTIAQMSQPDMRIPIQYAITYPNRVYNTLNKMDFKDIRLTFEKPGKDVLKTINMAYEALETGGTAPSVLNSANQAAVELFLNGEIGFLDITKLVEKSIKTHKIIKEPNLEEILIADLWAKKFVNGVVKPKPTAEELEFLM